MGARERKTSLLLGQAGRSPHLGQATLLQQAVHAGARQALLGRYSSGHQQAFNLVDRAPGVLALDVVTTRTLVRARHLRQHPSNGRIMKRVHAGGPRATSMESEAKNKDPKQRNQTALKSHLSTLHDSHSQGP